MTEHQDMSHAQTDIHKHTKKSQGKYVNWQEVTRWRIGICHIMKNWDNAEQPFTAWRPFEPSKPHASCKYIANSTSLIFQGKFTVY